MPVKWTRQLISSETFESAAVLDVNGDGVPDIVCGSYWYEGPTFLKRHYVCHVPRFDDYYDDFSAIALDVNGDGRMDIITGGWFGRTLRWRENSGGQAPWKEHVIAECGNIETTRAWDVDGDGQLEIVPNMPHDALRYYKLDRDPAGRGLGTFCEHVVWASPQGHGLGFGDINGDGRGEFVLAHGWLEQSTAGEWRLHPEFNLGVASVPIIVADVNKDGRADLIVGQAHPYGLDWWEQGTDAAGNRTWTRHPIDPFNSQYHDMHWVDIDGDGENELVTGKRYRAHPNDSDPGGFDDLGIYYFKWTGEGFSKQVITYGPPGVGAGCGIHFALADLRGTGRLDVIAPGKDGLHAFFNEGSS